MKTKNLYQTSKLVAQILKEDPATRNSDSYLYLKVLERISENNGINLTYMTVRNLFANLDLYGFPPFESVRRTRQKVQATYPELASAKKVAAMRIENEKVYRAYALGDADVN